MTNNAFILPELKKDLQQTNRKISRRHEQTFQRERNMNGH